MQSAMPSPAESVFSPIDFRSQLNDEQFAAVSAELGPVLVLAGAGSGKTRTLTYRVAWLLTKGLGPGEILLLTFTNKAANEMLRRVEELTGVHRSAFWGGTFHHIGYKTLRIFGRTVGLERDFSILDQDAAESLLKDTIRDTDASFLKDKQNPRPALIGAIISLARNTLSTIAEVIRLKYPYNANLIEPIEEFQRAYQEGKLRQQAADFDDLLVYWLRVLQRHPEAADYFRRRFKQILIDEYQDTNLLQSEIIDTIGSHHQIMAVGDDAQCIYTWRGASYENIITFPDRHPETDIYKIETNYRSTPEILGLANHVLASQPLGSGYRKWLRADRSPRESPFVVPVMDTRKQAQFVIKRLEGLVTEGYELSDVGVLYRAHYQALDMQVELSRLGVPYVITSGVRFFEQAHIRDFVAQLRFATNPQDRSAFSRFTCLLQRVGAKTAERAFARISQTVADQGITPYEAMASETVRSVIPPISRDEWTDLVKTIGDIHEAVQTLSPSDAVTVATEGWYSRYIKNIYPNWEDRLDDLDSLIGFAGRFEHMSELLAQLALLNSETADRSIDYDDNFLRLTTIHQAKGLEYAVVFVIGLAEGLFPLRRVIDTGDLEEERRLFYVAVTRARDELYLTYPMLNAIGAGPAYCKPSRFIEALPKESYEILRWQPTES